MTKIQTIGLIVLLGLSTHAHAALKVGLVLDKGGKDDKSFNAAAFRGATQAEQKLDIELKTVEASDDSAIETLLRTFAKKDYDLIIGIGFAQGEALKKVAAQNPTKKFAIVDAEVDLPNVRSLLFEEHQGSFLVGAIAAMSSQSSKIGFVGGMDIPLIRRFEMGYEAGAKSVNPKIEVLVNYVGEGGDAWNNPAKGKEQARSQYNSGADVIFAAAGASNLGVFDAAEEKKLYAIGVDSNQNWIKPGLILTSMLKRVDTAVFSVCQDTRDGKFTAGVSRYGLNNNGVDFAVDEHNAKILRPDMIEKANDIKAQIIANKISVPDYYKLKKK